MRIKKPRLRPIIIALSVGGILITSVLLIVVIVVSQRANIENDLLDANSSYAMKMSDVMSKYISMAQGELAYGAKKIDSVNDIETLKNETERLRLLSGLFNSVVVVGDDAFVLATSPESLGLVGVHLTSRTSKLAIKNKKPFISEPYKSATGNLIVLLSHPIFDKSGKYIGYIGGSIYLKNDSLFSDVLSQHFFKGDTEVSVVSNKGEIIFSKDKMAAGRQTNLYDSLKREFNMYERGEMVVSSAGSKYLVGYAHMKNTAWNVLVYSHADSVTTILVNYLKDISLLFFAIIVCASIFSSFIASHISSPLEKLAISTTTKDADGALIYIKAIRAWYVEAERLKNALFTHIKNMTEKVHSLSEVATKDHLTGLNNRLGFSNKTQEYKRKPGNSIIAIDIDFFKKINDSFGHDVGDDVLVSLAYVISGCCRSEDVICRFGGEEFIIFLPNTSVREAELIAERIRSAVEDAVFSKKLRVTVSAGVAAQDTPIEGFDVILKNADVALYQAKRQGRNKVVVYSDL